jgi:hypothetical protein
MANCPSCGTTLPADAPAGLCPACLARAARRETEPVDAETLERVRRTLAENAADLELGELIGRGGMGFVFRARQKRLGREVAVKVLDPELSKNPLFAERFAREAQALALLAHPHIVAVHDYGRAGELYYLVLEYVDGVNLRAVLKARTMSPEQALSIVPQICDALEFAHAHGVVHRDVKPENILLDRAGRVKITDFGLAKLLGVEVPLGSLTSTGQVLGTLRYMAPEQMERPLQVDHRADIYSLGVVFYEMLTGEIPMGRFAPPSKKVRIDVQLDEVVLRTLEREPEQRYQHAVEVKSDVEAIGAGRKLGRSPERERPVRRVSGLAVLSVVLTLVVPSLAPSVLAAVWLMPAWNEGVTVSNTVFILFAIFELACLLLGCFAGMRAVEHIRGDWPRVYGLGAALVGLWFLPLFALNAAAVAGPFAALAVLGVMLPEWAIVLQGIVWLAFDAWWIADRRRRILDELEPEAAGTSPAELSLRGGRS